MLVAVLGATGAAAGVARETSAHRRSARPFAAPDRAGPYAVGRTTIDVDDPFHAHRTVPVDVWYPASLSAAAGHTPTTMDAVVGHLGSEAAVDDPAVASGSFPLVVFSHGSGSFRDQSYFLTEHLASHGFIVAAPEHVGNSMRDALAGTMVSPALAANERRRDVSNVITALQRRSRTADDRFHGRVMDGGVGVIGHSFGGATAIATGVRWRGIRPDLRVKAIVPVAALSSAFSPRQLRSLTVPTLWLHGTSDLVVPIAQTDRAWSSLGSTSRYRIDLRRAGHASFQNACEIFYLAQHGPPGTQGVVQGQSAEACGPGSMPIDVAHRITNTAVLAFLEVSLLHDDSYERFLTAPAWSHQPVEFRAAQSLVRSPSR